MENEEQQETQGVAGNTVNREQILGVVGSFSFWPNEVGKEADQLLEDIDDSTIAWTDERVEQFLRMHPAPPEYADAIRTIREAEAAKEQERRDQEAAESIEDRKEQLRAARQKERDEGTARARDARLLSELDEEERRAAAEAAGTQVDPAAAARIEYGALLQELKNPISDERREEVHRLTEGLEDQLVSRPTVETVDFDPDEFLSRRRR